MSTFWCRHLCLLANNRLDLRAWTGGGKGALHSIVVFLVMVAKAGDQRLRRPAYIETALRHMEDSRGRVELSRVELEQSE